MQNFKKLFSKYKEYKDKYKESINISWQEAKTQIVIVLNEYLKQLSSDKDISIYQKWKIKTKIIPGKVNSALRDCDVTANLKE